MKANFIGFLSLLGFMVAQNALGTDFQAEDSSWKNELGQEEIFEIQRDPVVDHRAPKGDLVVKAINIQRILTDDVSGSYAQYVSIYVENIGTKEVKASSNEIQMNGTHYVASVFGPAPGIPNSFNLGAPIGPGKVGSISFYLPLNTLRHCQKVTGVIDTKHRLQFGPYSVFLNDSLGGVFVVDRSNIRACVDSVIIR